MSATTLNGILRVHKSKELMAYYIYHMYSDRQAWSNWPRLDTTEHGI